MRLIAFCKPLKFDNNGKEEVVISCMEISQIIKMSEENRVKFRDQIWRTRIARIHAEKRLKEKELYIQVTNIIYSAMLIVYSLISIIFSSNRVSVFSLIISFVLFVSMLFFNSQNYTERALAFKKSYTELQKLESRLDHAQKIDDDEVKGIEKQYCDLICDSENHSSYDYMCALYEHADYNKNIINKKTHFFLIVSSSWRFVIKVIIIVVPFILLILFFVGPFKVI